MECTGITIVKWKRSSALPEQIRFLECKSAKTRLWLCPSAVILGLQRAHLDYSLAGIPSLLTVIMKVVFYYSQLGKKTRNFKSRTYK